LYGIISVQADGDFFFNNTDGSTKCKSCFSNAVHHPQLNMFYELKKILFLRLYFDCSYILFAEIFQKATASKQRVVDARDTSG